MSTTFDVLPGTSVVPTYKEVIELANLNINTFLSRIDVQKKMSLSVDIQNIATHEQKIFNVTDIMISDEEHYAWFYFDNVPGGTDCYYYKNIPIDREIWEDELRTNLNAQKKQDIIKNNLNLGYRWVFRRSAGQPGIIALSYGMLAASLAELTNGIIYTDDGAWDYSLFPTTADDFLKWYFRPELASNEDCKTFAQDCINFLRDELK